MTAPGPTHDAHRRPILEGLWGFLGFSVPVRRFAIRKRWLTSSTRMPIPHMRSALLSLTEVLRDQALHEKGRFTLRSRWLKGPPKAGRLGPHAGKPCLRVIREWRSGQHPGWVALRLKVSHEPTSDRRCGSPSLPFQRIRRWREHLPPSSRRSSRFQTNCLPRQRPVSQRRRPSHQGTQQ
jgi:hypothetical protein